MLVCIGCSDGIHGPCNAPESKYSQELLNRGELSPDQVLWLKAAMVRMCDDYGWSEREMACVVTRVFESDMFGDSELDRRVEDIGCGYVYLADGERLEYSFEKRSLEPSKPGRWNVCRH